MKRRGRPPEITVRLTDAQRAELREVAKREAGYVSERAHFVLFCDQGVSVPEIARRFGYSAPTVYNWLRRYERKGVAGLRNKPRSGRKPQERLLLWIVAAQVCAAPWCHGYRLGCWTVELLRTHLATRFKVKASAAMIRRALKRAKCSWSRPKLVLPHRHDPQAEEKLKRLDEALNDPEGVVLSTDECDAHLMPVVRGTWHPEGRQPEVVTPGQNQKRGIFGAVDLRTGAFHYMLSARKRSTEFVTFVGTLVAAYPGQVLYVLVDNASIHTSKLTLKWVAEHPEVCLVYLPTYAGHKYNPIEKVWWYMKAKVSGCLGYRTLAELDEAIHRHFRGRTPADHLRLINSDVTRRAQASTVPISLRDLCAVT